MTLLKLTDRDGDIWYQSVDGADSYTTAKDETEPFDDGYSVSKVVQHHGPITAVTHEAPTVTLMIPASEAAVLLEILGWNVAGNVVRGQLTHLHDDLCAMSVQQVTGHPFAGTVTKAG